MEEKEEDISLLMACHKEEKMHGSMWYLDTGYSNHMCGDKSLFSDLDESFRSTIKFVDNSTVSIIGKGNVKIYTKDNTEHCIGNVYFALDLKTNLLSVGQLQEKGFEIKIKDGVCCIQNKEKGLVAEINMASNCMFPLHFRNTSQISLSTELKDESWLWNFRYGHLSFGGLQTLQQKNMVKDLPQFQRPSQVCEECVVGKQHRETFPAGKSRRQKQVLELIHSDICGPITPTSNGGKRYFITFIDDFSRKTWVYLLQEKSEALSVFKQFKALAENETEMSIKILRSDRGGEYNSREFVDFCETHGIQKQLITAYTPQQNGVSERKNRTIMNMVRTMLKMSGMPKSFWPEAVT